MITGTYIGKDVTLKGKTALLLVSDTKVKAQFDDVKTGYGYGWHQFEKDEWCLINEQEVIAWIISKGGTVRQFNKHVIFGRIHGLQYRYFITEGWIGLNTPDSPPGKGLECKTFEQFRENVFRHRGSDALTVTKDKMITETYIGKDTTLKGRIAVKEKFKTLLKNLLLEKDEEE